MGQVKTIEKWWNGIWGRLARLDVWLRTDGRRWDVWIREGGADVNRNRHTEYGTEAEARAELDRLKSDGRRWQPMPFRQ